MGNGSGEPTSRRHRYRVTVGIGMADRWDDELRPKGGEFSVGDGMEALLCS